MTGSFPHRREPGSPRPRKCRTPRLLGALLAGSTALVLVAAPLAPGPARATAQGASSPGAQADRRVVFPARVQQGAMVLGKVPPGSRVEYAGRTLRTTGYGTVVFGIGRDQAAPVQVAVVLPDGSREVARIEVTPRDWPVQRVDGVPPKTVS